MTWDPLQMSYCNSFTRLSLILAAKDIMLDSSVVDPVLAALPSLQGAEEETAPVASEQIRFLVERFEKARENLVETAAALDEHVALLREDIQANGEEFWREKASPDLVDQTFRSRISSTMVDLRADLMRRARAAAIVQVRPLACEPTA